MKYDFYYIPDFYTTDECKTITSLIRDPESNTWEHTTGAPGVINTATRCNVDNKSLSPLIDRFNDIITHINQEYFGLDIYPTTPYEVLTYNQYDATNQGEYSWHMDKVFSEPYDIKLTAILNISTDVYEGGELELFLNFPRAMQEFKPGTLLLFPSYIPHRVTPVTDGTRITLARWVKGPSFK